jgi:hypothetical protein
MIVGMQFKYSTLILLLALPGIVCAQQSTGQSGSAGGSDVAARVGDRVITVREVDEAWRKADPVEHTRATQLLYQGRKETLDRMVGDMLIEQAAKAKGVSPEQYAKEETAKRVKPITDDAVTAFYEQNKGRMQGKPLEDMRGAIRNFLEQQEQVNARNGLVADLRKAGPPVQVSIDAPRQTVSVAPTDPARGGANAPVVIVEFSDYQ